MKALVDYSKLNEMYIIHLDPTPNQDLTVSVNDKEFDIQIRTLYNNHSYMSILLDNEFLCYNHSICLNIDMTYVSKYVNESFFFVPKHMNIPGIINYECFGRDVTFCYGII